MNIYDSILYKYTMYYKIHDSMNILKYGKEVVMQLTIQIIKNNFILKITNCPQF